MDYLRVFTEFIWLDSGKFNTTVLIVRVIYLRAKKNVIIFMLSQCWLRLVCGFGFPEYSPSLIRNISLWRDPNSGSFSFPSSHFITQRSNLLSVLFFFSCKCRYFQEECPLLLDTLTIEGEATAMRRNVGILLPTDTATHPRRTETSATPLMEISFRSASRGEGS
jgi:hypothetical protein